jgi:hypothetical protein
MAVKPKITTEELIRILNNSKNLSDSETAAILNKDYTTSKYGKAFTASNVQAARYALGITTDTTKSTLGADKIKKVSKYLAKEIKKANDGDKFVSKQDIIKKAVIKFNIKTGAAQAKQKAGPRFRLDPGTYPILNTLESTEQKLDTVLKRMLMDDKPLGDLWYKTLAKRTGLSRDAISKSLKAGKVPTYNTIKDQGADLIIDRRLSSGQAKQILSGLSFSDQLTKANSLIEGRPIISFGASAGKTFQPKYTIMNFAFRNWDQNLGQGPIKFFDKKGKEIPWEFGKKLKGKDVSFSYNGKKYNLKNLSDTSVLKKDFAEAYKVTNEATAFKNRNIDNPFKPGSKIQVKDLIKKIQVDGYNWSPNYGTIDVLHGPKGVKGEPFTNLRFNTRDINTVEMTLNNSLRAGNITKSQFNESIKNLNEPFSGLKGKNYEQAIIDRAGTQAAKIQKGTFYGFDDFLTDIRADAANNGPICSVVQRKNKGGSVISCVDAVEDAIQNNPQKLTQDASKIGKFKNAALGFLKSPALRSFGKFGALGAGIGIVKQYMNDDASTYLSDEGQQKNMLKSMLLDPISPEDIFEESKTRPAILDYQLPVLAAEAAAGTAAVAPSTIKAARSTALGSPQSGITKTALKTLGRGLGTLGTPAGLLPIEAMNIGSQIAEGDSVADIASDPLNYLGAAFVGPVSDFATKGLSPRMAKLMRLGISPGALRAVSSRFGLPGLAISGGLSLYDYLNKKDD